MPTTAPRSVPCSTTWMVRWRPSPAMAPTSPLTKSSHPEKDTSYGMTNEDWHTAYGTMERSNRLRQRAVKADCQFGARRLLDRQVIRFRALKDFIYVHSDLIGNGRLSYPI